MTPLDEVKAQGTRVLSDVNNKKAARLGAALHFLMFGKLMLLRAASGCSV